MDSCCTISRFASFSLESQCAMSGGNVIWSALQQWHFSNIQFTQNFKTYYFFPFTFIFHTSMAIHRQDATNSEDFTVRGNSCCVTCEGVFRSVLTNRKQVLQGTPLSQSSRSWFHNIHCLLISFAVTIVVSFKSALWICRKTLKVTF